MKQTLISTMFLFIFAYALPQQNGKISSKEFAPKSGVENAFVYQPPKELAIPEGAVASIVFLVNDRYDNKAVLLVKNNDVYQFTFKAPDSTEALVIAITDKERNIIDNNNAAGFITYLNDKKGKSYPSAGITATTLLSGFASYMLKTKVPAATLLNSYNSEYKLHPELTGKKEYYNYLNLLYSVKKDTVKPQMIVYAKQMLQAKNDETKWMLGANIYRQLKMEEPLKKAESAILAVYPRGQLAKQKFWDEYYSGKQATEAARLAALRTYINKFRDSSTNVTDRFYNSIINGLLQKKNWSGVNKYEPLLGNKMQVAYAYNNAAWDLTGHSPDQAGSDLKYAKMLSKRSLDIVENQLNSVTNENDSNFLIKGHSMFADTYALILYQLNQYDSAFYYEDIVMKRGGMEADAMERYVTYAEKTKGALFAKQFIEPQLMKGINSPGLQKQLLSIYKQLNLPQDEYNKVVEKADLLIKEKFASMIRAKFGTQSAKDFTLKDLNGNIVSLGSLKNKVVVLDFWATWCGPCRASFPEMQQAVTKYKDDKEVVFLFIDAFERKEPKEMQEATAKFINDNKYTFQVLLDTKDEVATNYQVEAIPLKFVINKQGNIVFMANTINDIASVIETARK